MFEDLNEEDIQNMLSLIKDRHVNQRSKLLAYQPVGSSVVRYIMDTEFLLKYIDKLEGKSK